LALSGVEVHNTFVYFVYIILCQDSSFYTGITTNLCQRLLDHKNGKGGAYTRSHKPIKIVYQEQHPDKSSALKREAQIKSWTRKEKIQNFNL
jgi:putative endonuclease